MKKKFSLIIIGICIGFYLFAPEDSKLDIAYHTKTEKYNPKLAKFLIGTKVGRKLSYIFIRKSSKKKIKTMEKELKRYFKELEI